MNKKIGYLIGAIVVIIIGLFAYNTFLVKEEGLDITNGDDVHIGEGGMRTVEVISVNNLMVPDQAGGNEIFIERVLLKTGGTGGFVAIHKAEFDEYTPHEEGATSEDGCSAPALIAGELIGVSKHFVPGVSENQIITLNEGKEVVEGDMLFAVLYGDDGDTMFRAGNDPILKTVINTDIAIRFRILAEEDLPGFETKL